MVRFHVHRILLATVAIAALAAGPALAQQATAQASLTIVAPLSVSKTNDLEFGSIRVGQDQGAVTVSSTGARSASGGVSLVGSGTGSAAVFTVAGSGGVAYSISVPPSFTVGPFTATTAGQISTLPTSGAGSFSVGAVLGLPSQAAPGQYAGSLTITAIYD